MVRELGLKYKKAHDVVKNLNGPQNIFGRQKYAEALLGFLSRGFRVINIDEAIFNNGLFVRRTWMPRNQKSLLSKKSFVRRLSVIVAASSEGELYFSALHGNIDSEVFITFMHRLCQ